MKKNTSVSRITAIILSLLLVLGIAAPLAFVINVSAMPEEPPVAYLGDPHLCKMPKEMASAYADAIDRAQGEGYNKCALVDVAGDGMPLLLLCRATFSQERNCFSMTVQHDDLQLWVWDGTSAQRFTHRNLYDFDYHFGWKEDIPVLKTNTWQYGMAQGGTSYFRIKNGNLSLLKTYTIKEGPIYFIDDNPVSETEHYDDMDFGFSSYYEPFQFGESFIDITIPFSDCSAYSAYLKDYAKTSSDHTENEESSQVSEAPSADNSSNVSPNYELISTFKSVEDITDYVLNSLLYSVDFDVNDAAVNEIIRFTETAISNLCAKNMNSFGNKFTLDSRLKRTLEMAASAKDTMENFLHGCGLPLNNPIDVVVPVLWKNCNLEKKCRVAITENTCHMLSDIELRLYLGDNQHYLQFDYDNTDMSFYGGHAEYTFLKSNNTYEIDCVNKDGDSLFRSFLCVGLPAVSETCTVMETYGGETRNIGCQYDAASSVVFFETQSGGQYQVLDNSIQIDDIAHLPAETQNMIHFMVSNNYMDLNGTEFCPDDFLNRYQFAKALVGMFFVWRSDLTDAFPDIPADHDYFHYIASGKHENIIEGYDDGLYHGDDDITMEQMLSLAARILVNKKGYTYPDNYASILERATIDGTVSAWAQESVAMALRDGLWDYDETIHPQSPITKEQAALVLYRLFLLLQEVSPLTVDRTTNVLMVTVAAIASVVIVICIILIVILIRKNNQFYKRKKGNKNQ